MENQKRPPLIGHRSSAAVDGAQEFVYFRIVQS